MGCGQAATPIGSAFYRLIAADRCKAFARTLSVFTVGVGDKRTWRAREEDDAI
jgi:hypothetical protein